ncbi:hypothetical protein [Sinomicrobium weinanense]|uniref:Uncharacterized protein n=1 Tax=Sinomicrobium weinanense TaxID=2842200 RepID=A0A926Q460_9FLAO|nr:hypothetical protein [Sinomicrobium weinanense]MBC9798278.1 hypothetical protein [Sinomicrobium weinanense]MBU3125088.1 hypothetical protein [Sinomicrobium weinanense]
MEIPKYITLLILVIVLQSCGVTMVNSGSDFDKSEITEVEFCRLNNYQGQLIKTTLEYSGMEEYWGARGFEDCDLNNEVDLNFEEFYENERDYLIDPQLRRLYNNYPTHKAIMTVIGVFNKDTINGFGHLNSYPAEILVKSVRIKVKHK